MSDQITALFNNKLKSQLDVSFANANLAQAKLLLLRCSEQLPGRTLRSFGDSGLFRSAAVRSCRHPGASSTPPPDAVGQLVDQAFSNRPEIAAQDYEYQAAQHFQKAERDLLLPDIEALGTVGGVPVPVPSTDFSHSHLVWRDWSQRQHPDLQWLPVPGAIARSSAAGAGQSGAVARFERSHRQ